MLLLFRCSGWLTPLGRGFYSVGLGAGVTVWRVDDDALFRHVEVPSLWMIVASSDVYGGTVWWQLVNGDDCDNRTPMCLWGCGCRPHALRSGTNRN